MGGGGGSEPRETEAMRAQAEIGIEFFNLGQKTLGPALDLYEERMNAQFSEDAFTKAEGQGASAAQNQINDLVAENDRQLIAGGIDPTSGKFDSPALMAAAEKGMAKTRAGARSDQMDIAEGNVSNFIGLGLGQAQGTAQGQAELASRQQNRAMGEFGREQEKLFNRGQTAGYVAGLGTTAYMNRDRDPYASNRAVNPYASNTGGGLFNSGLGG